MLYGGDTASRKNGIERDEHQRLRRIDAIAHLQGASVRGSRIMKRPPTRSSPRIRPSYAYGWSDLDLASFRAIGLIARRSPNGAARFNLPQSVWLYPRVKMNWGPRVNRQVETLAWNILTAFVMVQPRGRGVRSCLVFTPEESRAFAELVICTMPMNGGCIPRGVIRTWIGEAIRARREGAQGTPRTERPELIGTIVEKFRCDMRLRPRHPNVTAKSTARGIVLNVDTTTGRVLVPCEETPPFLNR